MVFSAVRTTLTHLANGSVIFFFLTKHHSSSNQPMVEYSEQDMDCKCLLEIEIESYR